MFKKKKKKVVMTLLIGLVRFSFLRSDLINILEGLLHNHVQYCAANLLLKVN